MALDEPSRVHIGTDQLSVRGVYYCMNRLSVVVVEPRVAFGLRAKRTLTPH